MVYTSNDKMHPNPDLRQQAEDAADAWTAGYGKVGSHFGQKKMMRLEIPLTEQSNLFHIANILSDLSTRLHIASQNTRDKPRYVRHCVQSDIGAAQHKLKELQSLVNMA